MNHRKKWSNNGATEVFSETFTYDPLDRLTQWQVTNKQTNVSQTQTVGYSNNGNIAHKSDMGLYTYSAQKPNAVVNISNLEGQAHTVAEHEIEYTLFNKTSHLQLISGGYGLGYDITYGPDDHRRKSQFTTPGQGVVYSTIYSGLFEERSNGDRLYYIKSPAGLSALVVTNKNDASKRDVYYLYNDHLGSLIAVQKQGTTALAAEFSYDPWGRRRNPADWHNYEVVAPTLFTRGYTGHEHLDEFRLINMNGRMYDPRLARFLSPDPLVQSPGYTQSYNRYSYVWNNPLRYTDPSGYYAIHLDENTMNVPYIAGGSGFAANWYSVLTSRGVVPGSGRHWSDALHGEGIRNLMLMNSDEYVCRFGKES